MKILPENSVSFVSKYMVYMALPAYLIYYMPASISMEMLADYWYYPFLGAFLVATLDVFGYVTARLWAGQGEHATFRLLVAFSNWVFMALAVCEPLFHADGIRMVLLYNIGLMFYLWTFGLTGFRPAGSVGGMVKKLFLNPQTVSLMIGFCVAILLPVVKGIEKLDAGGLAALPVHIGLLSPLWDTVYLIASTTMPLAILQIGMLLGAPKSAPEGVPVRTAGARSVVIVSALRLLAAPVLVLGVQAVLVQFGILRDRAEFVTSVIIMAMPVATLSFTVAEVHGGASRLAARTILWSTVASLFTAPVLTWLAEVVYGGLA
jgi:predicted permease